MRSAAGHRSTRFARHRWSALGLAVAGAAALVAAQLSSHPASPAPPAPPDASAAETRIWAAPLNRPASGPVERTADRLRGRHLPASDPVSVRIPALGVSAPLSRLGLAPDGTLATPQSAGEVGWFDGSVTPGALGPAVIAGHVTWGGEAAVFHELAALRRSDRVLVSRQDGRVAVFEVTDVGRFPKTRFPTRAVYGPTNHAALRLITCGGRYDPTRGHYEDNVVVFGRLVAVRP